MNSIRFLRIAVVLRVAAVAIGAVACLGQTPARATTPPSATIRIWGSPQMSDLLRQWEAGFGKQHPEIHFHDELHGTASGIAALYTSVADIALMGREIWPSEQLAFQTVFPWKPTEVEVATGSYDIPKATFALVAFVHKSNPLTKLTLEQLAIAFGSRATSWRDLGLSGEWSAKPVHGYNFDYDNDKSIFFRRRVLQGRYRWDSGTREFSNQSTVDAGQLILEALARDPLGIAISNPHYANADVKALAIVDALGQPVFASVETVRNRTYPLTRAVYIYLNRDPKKPAQPEVQMFLNYVLSAEGQQDVLREGTYQPLSMGSTATKVLP